LSERGERRYPVVARVPASTANLGPGFDALGMALTLYAEVGVTESKEEDRPAPVSPRAHVVGETHPADVAFRQGGGRGALWVRSPIPSGRGLGFSGAMRVGGLVAAWAQAVDGAGDLASARAALLGPATDLEGHGDNVAASLYGGVVATAAGRAVPVPLAIEPAVVAWVPSFTTATQQSRAALPSRVPFGDAVFNIGRTALLVAALAAGDVDALRRATEDRLHQDRRLLAAPPARAALAAGLESGAWCGWLSGSGPTVALLCSPDDAGTLSAALPAEGRVKVLGIDRGGATLVPDPGSVS
jgi:homoserine kinase